MKFTSPTIFSGLAMLALLISSSPRADEPALSLEEARLRGAAQSKYRTGFRKPSPAATTAPKANLEVFRKEIQPLLDQACASCHGADKQKGDLRVDTLDPNLLVGKDVNWWVEVVDVISNGEMPPEDEAVELSDTGRAKIIDWLTQELQVASQLRRTERGHSSFRRLTRYEYNYALQDLLGLPHDFASDLPPEAASEDGFKNSSEMLQMSVTQLELYRELGRRALQAATVKGEKPAELYFAINAATAAKALVEKMNDPKLSEKDRKKFENVSTTSNHYFDRTSGEAIASIRNNLRDRAHPSIDTLPEPPPPSSKGFVLPGGTKRTLNLGSEWPETGYIHVRVRADRMTHDGSPPRLRLHYGFQASNNSHATEVISDGDLEVSGNAPAFYAWRVPLAGITRNPFRGQRIPKVNSTESILIENTHPDSSAAVFIDYIEVSTPGYEQWPPDSHTRLFPKRDQDRDELDYAREVLTRFMQTAWRREIAPEEIDQKLAYYEKIRPSFGEPQGALIEVMANLLASPNFLYVVQSPKPDAYELATRLSIFLWSSLPDRELLSLAGDGKLIQTKVLEQQVSRMLADPKAERFSTHFVRQWLGMELLDYLKVDEKKYRDFKPALKHAMQQEPIALFNEVLHHNRSIMDFLHADYVMVNDRLAKHYQINNHALGGELKPSKFDPSLQRGGPLTQAGLLAMNSDGKDSHPLKRGIWLLEKMLNDPPPPPPPSVPEIDLADPAIAQMTLKERMEDHRNDPACMSCHARIDPWGVAFENFDALGSWRKEIDRKPVDAEATLFNGAHLDGMEGLKRYLLLHRQDQFASALTHKLSAYALGRPIAFGDRAELEEITARFRQEGDGLSTLVSLVVTSNLFTQ